MIQIEDEEGGVVQMTTALFLAIAKVQDLYGDADVTVTFEDRDEDGNDVWHVITNGNIGIIEEAGRGYEYHDYRYVLDGMGELQGVEKLVFRVGEETGDWRHVKVNPDTWEEEQ